MDRRRQDDNKERDYRRRDEYENDYRGRSRYGRDDRTRNKSRSRSTSTSTSRDRNRIREPRSKSPRRHYHDNKTSYNKSSYSTASNNKSNYHDLDRQQVPKENKYVGVKEKGDVEMKEKGDVGVKENGDFEMKEKEDVVNHVETEELLDAQLAAFLGITSFTSTKGQKVAGNAVNFAVDATKKKREYRQYLFVKGAYDIPLTKDQMEAKEKEEKARNQHH